MHKSPKILQYRDHIIKGEIIKKIKINSKKRAQINVIKIHFCAFMSIHTPNLNDYLLLYTNITKYAMN